jgi:hypothetical protein
VDQAQGTRNIAKVGVVAILGIGLIIGGGVVAKIALGGWLVGWLKTQPLFARP